jgi:hypothetical protein
MVGNLSMNKMVDNLSMLADSISDVMMLLKVVILLLKLLEVLVSVTMKAIALLSYEAYKDHGQPSAQCALTLLLSFLGILMSI